MPVCRLKPEPSIEDLRRIVSSHQQIIPNHAPLGVYRASRLQKRSDRASAVDRSFGFACVINPKLLKMQGFNPVLVHSAHQASAADVLWTLTNQGSIRNNSICWQTVVVLPWIVGLECNSAAFHFSCNVRFAAASSFSFSLLTFG
jgi:hypothetical protein